MNTTTHIETSQQPEPVVIRFDTCGTGTSVTMTSQADPTRSSTWDFDYSEQADEFVDRFRQSDAITVVEEILS